MIDLHIHTNYSDGTNSVLEILDMAEREQLEAISITDHDTIKAYNELLQDKTLRNHFSGMIIPGCEFKTNYQGISIEILGYGFDLDQIVMPQNDTFALQRQYLEYFKEVLKQYNFQYNQDNLYISQDDPTHQFASFVLGTELCRYPENREEIVKLGYFTPDTFFRRHQTNRESPFYIDESKNYPTIAEINDLVHAAGGVTMLAHPYEYPFLDWDNCVTTIIETSKLDGLEVIHSRFTSEQMANLMTLSHRYSKLMSGGTDYHGQNKPDIQLGTGVNGNVDVPLKLIKNWSSRVNKL